MSIHGGIPGGSGEVLAIPVRDVLASFGVSEPLGKTEVDHIHVVLLLADSNQEVVGLDVPVEEVP